LDVHEADVLHARLQHKSVEERRWEIGIGKGGQMYSMTSSFGETVLVNCHRREQK